MHSNLLRILPSLVLALSSGISQIARADDDAIYEGTWVYSVYNNLSSDIVLVTVTRAADGTLDANITIPAVRIVADFADVAVTDSHLQILNQRQPIFEATLAPGGETLHGKLLVNEWIPMTLVRMDGPIVFHRPQDPQQPVPYREEEVRFRSGEIQLGGTLTLPHGVDPAAAVVLLSGSGPDGRDYLVSGHYPFWVIADYLTRLGIAVLRFDDRGVGESEGDFASLTTADLAADALAAVEFLQNRPEIDPRRVGLIGHSDGAGGAALAASISHNVAFIVMLGGLGVTGEQHLLLQTESTWSALGAPEARIAWQLEVQQGIIDILKSGADPVLLQERLDAYVIEINAGLTPERLAAMGLPPEFPGLTGIVGSVAWLQYLISYNPREALLDVDCSVLALNGDRDVIVSSVENLAAIEQALADGGNPDVTVIELPGLNHFFQTCEAGIPAEYVWIEETISPEVLSLLGDWIVSRTGGREPLATSAAAERHPFRDGVRFFGR